MVATDDNGTPSNPLDDFTVTAGAVLEVGHSWTFQKSVVLPMVTANTEITNTATVTALGSVGDVAQVVSATATATVDICVPTPPPTTPLAHGETATIGFWHNKNGQALIDSLNGGPSATNLANWLASEFPYLYGVNSTTNLTNKTNADVAALFLQDFSVTGMKTDAQILGAALATYVTNSTLAGNAAVSYGFVVSSTGTGSTTYNVGSYGTAIGLSNNTSYTVFALLQQANYEKFLGTFNANAFNSIFDGINQAGDIS